MCKKISSRTFVILRTWIRKEVAFYSWMQTKRRMGQSRRADDDQIQRRRTPSFPSHESIVPWNAQKQRRWKIIFSLLCRWGYGWNCFFAQIFLLFRSVSVEQSQICVMNTVFVKQETERPVLAGQSDPFFQPARMLITTPTFSVEVFAQENLLQKYKERVERLTQQDRLIKICMDAGFLTTVEVGQYVMTKDTDEFLQSTEPVTCREYILPRDEQSIDPKGWIRGNTKIGPVLEVTTSFLQGNYGVDIRIASVNKDNSHSRVRISHGLNKLVTDLIDKEYDDNEQETSEMKTEEFVVKTGVCAFASP